MAIENFYTTPPMCIDLTAEQAIEHLYNLENNPDVQQDQTTNNDEGGSESNKGVPQQE
ncbi:hypothetical protein ACFL1Q_00375 [Patescibacteria group bacterium]